MTRVLLWPIVTLVVLIAVIVAVGWFLPVGHVASRSVVVSAPPAVVFDTVSNVEQFPSWWTQVSRVDVLPAESGRTRFRQHDDNGSIVMEVVERTPPTRIITRIADPDQPFGGSWTWEIVPQGSGSRVTITERGEVYNPLFRFLSRFVFGHTSTIDSALTALEDRFRTKN